MTVTKRKRNKLNDESQVTEPGVRYTCDACSADISHTVRIQCAQLVHPDSPQAPPRSSSSSSQHHQHQTPIRNKKSKKNEPNGTGPGAGSSSAASSATGNATPAPPGPDVDPDSLTHDEKLKYGWVHVCEDFDLCGACFCEGVQVGRHKATHDYRVIEQHAYPIYVSDWGADEEMLLIDAAQTYGIGNWADIAEHVGSYRSKEEVERHYYDVYLKSQDYPHPQKDPNMDPDHERFQQRKRKRLEEAQNRDPPQPPPKPLASVPTCHEVGGYMPGRLEFEHEWENDAELLVKDLEFGLIYEFGGDSQPAALPEELESDAESDNDEEKDQEAATATNPATQQTEENKVDNSNHSNGEPPTTPPKKDNQQSASSSKTTTTATPRSSKRPPAAGAGSSKRPPGAPHASTKRPPGQKDANSNSLDASTASQDGTNNATASNTAVGASNGTPAPADDGGPGDEDPDELRLKLALLDMYCHRYDKRVLSKAFIFDRGLLLDYKKAAAADRKKEKHERELVARLRVFARLQTSLDHEAFVDGLLYENSLRRKIAELQELRRAGVTTFAEAEKYEKEKVNRINSRGALYRDALLYDRKGSRDNRNYKSNVDKSSSSGTTIKKKASPTLTLSTAASLQLLSNNEVQFCSTNRILPRPFLFAKENLIRLYSLHGRKLTRDIARASLSSIDEYHFDKLYDYFFHTTQLTPSPTPPNNNTNPNPNGDSNNHINVNGHSSPTPPLQVIENNNNSNPNNLNTNLNTNNTIVLENGVRVKKEDDDMAIDEPLPSSSTTHLTTTATTKQVSNGPI